MKFGGQQMHHNRRSTRTTAVLVALVLIAIAGAFTACNARSDTDDTSAAGTSGPPNQSPTSDRARTDAKVLCKFNREIYAASNSAHTPDEQLAVLKRFQPRFQTALAAAPAEIKPSVQALVRASEAAIRANDLAAARSDAVAAAGYQLDRYCGITRR